MNFVAAKTLPSPGGDETGRGSSIPHPRVPANPFIGASYLQEEINEAVRELSDHVRWLKATAKALDENFRSEDMVQTKLAAEHLKHLALTAKAIVPRKLNQIEIMAGSMAGTFGKHIRREPRNDRI